MSGRFIQAEAMVFGPLRVNNIKRRFKFMKVYMVGNSNIRNKKENGEVITRQFVKGKFYKIADVDFAALSQSAIKESSKEYKEFVDKLESKGVKITFADPVVLKEKSSLIPSGSNPVAEEIKEALAGKGA